MTVMVMIAMMMMMIIWWLWRWLKPERMLWVCSFCSARAAWSWPHRFTYCIVVIIIICHCCCHHHHCCYHHCYYHLWHHHHQHRCLDLAGHEGSMHWCGHFCQYFHHNIHRPHFPLHHPHFLLKNPHFPCHRLSLSLAWLVSFCFRLWKRILSRPAPPPLTWL